eukprot:scaffold2134_cov93-Cylindrotheca_fusiformis.AAC.4
MIVNNTTVSRILSSSFPKALSNEELVSRVSSRLGSLGFSASNTLLVTSLCCDELSRPLEQDFAKAFGPDHYQMGGLAGFPFGGVTGFRVMLASSRIPEDGGNCLVVYGPHVGISSTGEIGTVERDGRRDGNGGPCCHSAKASLDYVLQVHRGTQKPHPGIELFSNPQDVINDAQQMMVDSLLLPYAQRLDDAGKEDVMIELPMALYEASTQLLGDILLQQGGARKKVESPGSIAVVGGIQINTPPKMSDYFMPLQFQLYDYNGKQVDDLLWHDHQ